MSTIYWRACAGRSRLGWLLAAAGCLLMADLPAIAADTLPSETPSEFVPRVDTFDYSKREVMTRPLRGPLNPSDVDHSTDTYDTIDWLIKNIPESNGKVGILGISYDGFTSLMALVNPHPALRAAIPINAMVDGWMGDDWFHKGAFRQDSLTYIHGQEATRGSDISWWTDHYDDYETWLSAGSAGEMARRHGLEQVGFATKVMNHPAYDEFWQDQALDKILAKQNVAVPVMLVHSLWDQEDIYGNIALYKALKAQQADTSKD